MCIYTHKMYEIVSTKEIIDINQQFAEGIVLNSNSLDFAVKEANQTKSWLRACSVLVQAILIDHVFDEGNKRTAASIMISYFEARDIRYKPETIARIITTILMKNITNLIQIERMIKHGMAT